MGSGSRHYGVWGDAGIQRLPEFASVKTEQWSLQWHGKEVSGEIQKSDLEHSKWGCYKMLKELVCRELAMSVGGLG